MWAIVGLMGHTKVAGDYHSAASMVDAAGTRMDFLAFVVIPSVTFWLLGKEGEQRTATPIVIEEHTLRLGPQAIYSVEECSEAHVLETAQADCHRPPGLEPPERFVTAEEDAQAWLAEVRAKWPLRGKWARAGTPSPGSEP